METHTVPGQRLKCSTLSVPKLKVEAQEETKSETIVWCKDEKVVDLHLKHNGEESSSDDKFVPGRRIKNEKEELDQKESDLCLEKSSYIKWESGGFEKIPVKSKDRDIDKEFDNNVIEPYEIKKETNEVNVAAAEELNYINESRFKSEFIEQKEVHIKDEEDIKDSLNEKTSEHRKQTVLHQCPECPYSTIRKYDLKAHSVRHKQGDEIDWHSCPECPYKTYRKRYLMRHTEIHNNLILNCSKCSYKTLKSSELKRHQIEHKTNIQWLHCPECPFKTHMQSYYRKHSLTHESETFSCTDCSYQAKRKAQLTIHQVKHESMDKWHFCPLCPFKSHAKNLFESHCRRRHSIGPSNPNQIEIFKCIECSYESGSKHNLKVHQLVHDRSNWLQCPECAYKTHRKDNLKKHQLRHQGENAEGWHRCSECPYKTSDKSYLRRHVISHKSNNEIRLFECPQCSFKTAYKNNLRQHELKHKKPQEIEWFCCYECSFKTKHKSSLVSHIISKRKKQIDKGFSIIK